MEAERARQAEEEAQRKASLLQEALESLRSGDNPHLALHQLQLLHRLPLESILSLQAQLCSCLQAVEQVTFIQFKKIFHLRISSTPKAGVNLHVEHTELE